MSTSHRAVAWLVGVVLVSPVVAGAQVRSERDIVDEIVRDRPQAAAIRAGTEVVRLGQLARQAPANPSVSYRREGVDSAEFVEFEQSLGFLGTRHALERAGVAAVRAAEAERDARLWLLRSEAMTALVRLRRGRRRQEIAARQVGELERLLGILQTREREGEGSRLDRLRAEQELQEVRTATVDAAAEIAEATAAIEALLPAGSRLGAITPVTRAESTSPTLDALLARSVVVRPELAALRAAGEQATAEGVVLRRSRLPIPNVFGGITRADAGERRTTGGVFGASVNVALFDRGARETARWEAERRRIDADGAALEHQIRAEVGGAFAVWQARQAFLRVPDDTGDEVLQIAEVAYREGEVGILELLDAVRTVFRARQRQIERNFSARLAEIAVERAVGEVVWP